MITFFRAREGKSHVNPFASAVGKVTKGQHAANAVITTANEGKMKGRKGKREKFNRNKERLRSDIGYLHALATKIVKRTDIDEDLVQAHVKKEAVYAKNLLKERENFWSLMDNCAKPPKAP